MGKPLVELENLTKYFDVSKKDKLHAVDGITLTINEGETLGGCRRIGMRQVHFGPDCSEASRADLWKNHFRRKGYHKL